MAMLGLTDILRRREATQQASAHDVSDPSVEAEMETALELGAADEEPAVDQEPVYPATDPTDDIEADVLADAPTPHAQALLAAFSVFEEANTSTRDELTKIGKAFTSIVTNFNLGRDFLDGCRQEILRASEMEQANLRLSAQNRRLTDRADKLEHLRERLDDQLDTAKRREARLIQEADTLRMTVSDLRLETVELRNANANAEHGRSEMHQAFASRTADVERLARENEVLREKVASMTAELDQAHRRQTEMRLKMEETQSTQSSEAVHLAEIAGRLGAAEKEVLRLQKQCDVSDAQLRETALALQSSEHEVWERDRRHQAEIQALKGEVSQLQQRLSLASLRPDAPEEEAERPLPQLRQGAPDRTQPNDRTP